MTLLQFEVFITVAQLKSFTAASEKLGYTQSAVSQMIRSLEEELQVKLLNRSRREGVTLTVIGERMLNHMKEVSKIKRMMEQEASSFNNFNRGSVKVGVSPSISSSLLPGVVASFRKKYPEIQLIIFEGSYDLIHSMIGNNEIDLGFTLLKRSGGSQIPILDTPLKVILPENHLLSLYSEVFVEQLHESCFILPKGDSEDSIREILRSTDLKPSIRYEIQDISTTLAMVKEGIAFTILPEVALPKQLDGVMALNMQPLTERTAGFMVKDIQSILPGAAEFVLHAKNYLKE